MKRFKDQLKKQLASALSIDQLELLPSGYQKIGDIVILNLKPQLKRNEKQIGAAVLKTTPDTKTVCARTGGISGELRVPKIKKIAGNGTITTHTENGCRYSMDVKKVMFAKGNVRERGRLPPLIRPGETIVDMFAGIGYFAIPIAVHAKPEMIIAIEKNPISIKFLKDNIKLNNISSVEIIEADNRESKGLEGFADRVLMGYLPGTEQFLPAAFKFLKPEGGIIHLHNTYKKQQMWETPTKQLEVAAKNAGYVLDKISYKGIVKHFAPGVEHIVIDAAFTAS